MLRKVKILYLKERNILIFEATERHVENFEQADLAKFSQFSTISSRPIHPLTLLYNCEFFFKPNHKNVQIFLFFWVFFSNFFSVA